MYERLTWKFKDSWEIKERHSGKYGAPKEKRTERKKPTPEEMRENNRRNRIAKNRRLIKWNFVPEEDYWVTFTYRPDQRPEDRKQALKIMENFRKCLHRRFDKAETTMKWICITEIGSKGIKLLYKEGDFQGLARYLCKESKINRSRNLIEKDPEIELMKRGTWTEEIKVPKGFYLDRDSVWEGVNKFGFKYRNYIIVKTEGEKHGKRRNLHRSRQKSTRSNRKVRGVSPGNNKNRKDIPGRGRDKK